MIVLAGFVERGFFKKKNEITHIFKVLVVVKAATGALLMLIVSLAGVAEIPFVFSLTSILLAVGTKHSCKNELSGRITLSVKISFPNFLDDAFTISSGLVLVSSTAAEDETSLEGGESLYKI